MNIFSTCSAAAAETKCLAAALRVSEISFPTLTVHPGSLATPSLVTASFLLTHSESPSRKHFGVTLSCVVTLVSWVVPFTPAAGAFVGDPLVTDMTVETRTIWAE